MPLVAGIYLFQLEDDRHYFPPYQAVFIARPDKMSVLQGIFERLGNSISTEQMRKLNYEVDGRKRTPAEVAAEWVRSN